MCGRFLFIPTEDEDILYDTYSVQNRIPLEVNFNVAPTHTSPVITKNSPNKIQMMNWGIKFPWMKGSEMLINARAETITSKTSFKGLLQNRCVVLTSGYYEWKSEAGRKVPFLIKKEGEIFTPMAGLFEFRDENGSANFLIITKKATSTIKHLHERMPILLDDLLVEMWLDKNADIEVLIEMLSNVSHKLEFYQVNDRVNSIRNNDSMLIKPV